MNMIGLSRELSKVKGRTKARKRRVCLLQSSM